MWIDSIVRPEDGMTLLCGGIALILMEMTGIVESSVGSKYDELKYKLKFPVHLITGAPQVEHKSHIHYS